MFSQLVNSARNYPKLLTAACAVFLFGLNAYICSTLFNVEITKQTGSIEAAFIAFYRWQVDHWDDRSWFPMWMNGVPLRQVYNPLLHSTVPWFMRHSGWTAAHAYHFITAITYCLGPVTLFWLCDTATKRRGFALLAALLYSLTSPSSFLLKAIRDDAGGLWMPRRFQTLVQYGEGPHVTALMWIPLVIWLLDQAVANRRWKFLPLAAMSLAAVVLTNWTGTTGLLMALAAYVFSKIGAESAGGRSLHWPSFVGVGAVAYMLASFWVPPSLIQSVQASAAKLDVETPLLEKLWVLIPVALLMVCLHLVMQRMRVQSWTRFFLYYALISGIVLVSKVWWGTVLVPIAHRFHLEMEIALSAAAAMIALAIASRLPRAVQAAALAVLIVGGVILTRTYHRAARAMSQPIDFSTTTEFKQAQWFAQNMQNQRVFAGGTTSFWMNLYSDVPQVFGCCDQSARNDEIRMALYVIYSGEGTGDRDGEIATLWLKAYGASAISVMGNGTSQLGQPFGNPRKFDGVLQAAWRDGDSAIYRVPRPNNSLAHVVPNAALSQRRPINGIDIEPLLPLVDALDHPPSLATFRWINQHQAEVTAHTEAGQSIFIQETCDAGWHAGSEYTIACGPLGFMKIEPRTTGDHTIRLNYSGSTEDHIARGAQLAGVAILLIWTLRARRRPTAR